jgi:hypothetical protein
LSRLDAALANGRVRFDLTTNRGVDRDAKTLCTEV